MKRIILYAAIIEIVYLSLSNLLAFRYGQWSYEGEIARTVLRVVSIVYYGYYYQKYFYTEYKTIKIKEMIRPQLIAAVSLLMFFAMVYTNAHNETLIWQTVFAISGLTAGLREELFYRGIIQNCLQKKYDQKIALVLTTAVFVLSHVQYFFYGQYHGLLLITMAGIIFGSIYLMTGSVAITAIVHGLYDAVLSIEITSLRISNDIALPIFLSITFVFLMINPKLFRARQSKSAETSTV